ncbi:hypothetical protein CRENBAI_018397 [Crenichthys baileyi]|uniref:Uncharacterized protein n=1 Tax=Crenichthys baileyi TaxID=28760 RepID=A0AAV9QYX4_9TELE
MEVGLNSATLTARLSDHPVSYTVTGNDVSRLRGCPTGSASHETPSKMFHPPLHRYLCTTRQMISLPPSAGADLAHAGTPPTLSEGVPLSSPASHIPVFTIRIGRDVCPMV